MKKQPSSSYPLTSYAQYDIAIKQDVNNLMVFYHYIHVDVACAPKLKTNMLSLVRAQLNLQPKRHTISGYMQTPYTVFPVFSMHADPTCNTFGGGSAACTSIKLVRAQYPRVGSHQRLYMQLCVQQRLTVSYPLSIILLHSVSSIQPGNAGAVTYIRATLSLSSQL